MNILVRCFLSFEVVVVEGVVRVALIDFKSSDSVCASSADV